MKILAETLCVYNCFSTLHYQCTNRTAEVVREEVLVWVHLSSLEKFIPGKAYQTTILPIQSVIFICPSWKLGGRALIKARKGIHCGNFLLRSLTAAHSCSVAGFNDPPLIRNLHINNISKALNWMQWDVGALLNSSYDTAVNMHGLETYVQQ